MNIKYVYFDCWDTLIKFRLKSSDNIFECFKPHIKNIDSIDIHSAETIFHNFHKKYYSTIRGYELTYKVFCKAQMNLSGIELDIDLDNDDELEAFQLELLEKYYDPIPTDGIICFLDYLKSNGIRMGVISNTIYTKKFTRAAIEKGLAISAKEFDSYFDFIIVSSEEGLKKPNPDFFRVGMRINGCKNPSEAIYIGDSPYADVYGSYQANMNPCHFNWRENYIDELDKLNGLIKFKDYKEMIDLFKQDKDYIVSTENGIVMEVSGDVY